jgi:hypothetical protein
MTEAEMMRADIESAVAGFEIEIEGFHTICVVLGILTNRAVAFELG